MSSERLIRVGVAGAVLVGLAVGGLGTGWAADLERQQVRSFGVPTGMRTLEATVDTSRSGTTLVAGTVGTGANATCTVVLATPSAAAAYPYRQGDGGSLCVGAAIHSSGGFVVRGFGGRASEGEVAGFTASVDAKGRERWLLTDVPLVEDSGFLGTYVKPDAALAHSSEEAGRTLAFTRAKVRFGMLDERPVTYVSVIRGGEYERRVRTLGSRYGFGRVVDAEWRSSASEFFVALRRPSTGGTQLLTYGVGRGIDEYAPLGSDWSTRYVRDVEIGPNGSVYLVWTDTEKGDGPTHVTTVDSEGKEKWEERYSGSVQFGESMDDGETALGTPTEIRAGPTRAVVGYEGRPLRLRGLDAATGEELGVAEYPGGENRRGVGVVYGRNGGLRLLVADTEAGRFREYRFAFGRLPEEGDTGTADIGSDGGRRNIGAEGGEKREGCALSGTREPTPLGQLVAGLLAMAMYRRLSRDGT